MIPQVAVDVCCWVEKETSGAGGEQVGKPSVAGFFSEASRLKTFGHPFARALDPLYYIY